MLPGGGRGGYGILRGEARCGQGKEQTGEHRPPSIVHTRSATIGFTLAGSGGGGKGRAPHAPFTYDRIYKTLVSKVQLSDVSSTFAMEEIKMTTAIALSTD